MANYLLAPVLFAATLLVALVGGLSLMQVPITAGLVLGTLAAAAVVAGIAWQAQMACMTARWNAGRSLR